MEGKRNMIKVKLIATDGQAAIIEYQSGDRIERAIVPNGEVAGSRISKQALEQGIPYGGVELLDYLPRQLIIETSDLQDTLRQRGLWNQEDYLQNPNVILGALQKLYGVDVGRILNLVSEAE
jgi:hypothetical protein